MPPALGFMILIPDFFSCTWALGPKWVLGIHYTLSKFYGVNAWVLGKIKTSLLHTGKSCLLLLRFSPSISQASTRRHSSIQVTTASLYPFNTRASILKHPHGGQRWTLSQSAPSTIHSELPSISLIEEIRNHTGNLTRKMNCREHFFFKPSPHNQYTPLTCTHPHTIHVNVSYLHTCHSGYLLFLLDQYSLPFLW